MYPFPVVLLGSPEGLTGLETVLATRASRLLGTFPDLRAFHAAVPSVTGTMLFIVHLRGEDDLQHLRLLSDTCPGNPIIALVEGDCDVSVLFGISRAGASQLVSCPFTESDLAVALDRVTRQFGRVPPLAKLLVICGVVGGAGATTLTLNLGFELAARWEKACLLAEPTVPFGRLGSYLDLTSSRSTKELFYAEEPPDLNRLQRGLIPVADRVQLLASPPPTFPVVPVTGDRIQALVNGCRQVADVVLVDLPGPFTDTDFQLVSQSDEVLLLTDATVPGLQAMQVIREAVTRKRGSGPVRVVVNRVPANMDLAHLRQILNVDTVWALAEDLTGVPQAVDKGGPLRAFAPDSPMLAGMNQLLTTLFGPPSVSVGASSIFRRWLTGR